MGAQNTAHSLDEFLSSLDATVQSINTSLSIYNASEAHQEYSRTLETSREIKAQLKPSLVEHVEEIYSDKMKPVEKGIIDRYAELVRVSINPRTCTTHDRAAISFYLAAKEFISLDEVKEHQKPSYLRKKQKEMEQNIVQFYLSSAQRVGSYRSIEGRINDYKKAEQFVLEHVGEEEIDLRFRKAQQVILKEVDRVINSNGFEGIGLERTIGRREELSQLRDSFKEESSRSLAYESNQTKTSPVKRFLSRVFYGG